MEEDVFFTKLTDWLERRSEVALALLTGSRAEPEKADQLSDYDVALFCHESSDFEGSSDWLIEIAPLWVSIPEQFAFKQYAIPTRLAIFSGGHKVDFAFFPLEALTSLQELPEEFHAYRVLVDQGDYSQQLPAPTFSGFKVVKPSREEFSALIEEFWFEVYHVAKYLWRVDLWSMHFRLASIHHTILVKMIYWHQGIVCGEVAEAHIWGKRMEKWVDKGVWQKLQGVAADFSVQGGERALLSLIKLFSQLAKEVATTLQYHYPHDLENKMTSFAQQLLAVGRKNI